MKHFIAITAVTAFLFGCQVIDPSVAQLERFQTAAKDGRLRDISSEAIVTSCATSQPACSRLYAIKADACLALAMADRAAGSACPALSPASRQDLDCAATAYAAAMSAPDPSFSNTDRIAHRRGRAQALYCRAEFETASDGVVFAREALDVSRQLPQPERERLSGWSALFLARPGAGSDVTRCERAREALRFAQQGLGAAQNSDDRATFARLIADAEARQRSIVGCTP